MRPAVCIVAIVCCLGLAVDASGQVAGVGIPAFPGSEVNRMGGRSMVNDRELLAYYFTTRAPMEEVAEYYHKRWDNQGQLVSVLRTPGGGLSVGYFDLGTGQARSVSLWRNGSVTYGFPAVIYGVPLPAMPVSNWSGPIPVQPQAEGLMTYESLEHGGVFTTINYSVQRSRTNTQSFFMREMGAKGWSLEARNTIDEDKNLLMLEFVKGKKRMNVTLVWVPAHHRCSVFIVVNFSTHIPRESKP